MKHKDPPGMKDTYLEERFSQYDAWMKEGKIDFSSKVLPIRESLEAKQWVMPSAQVVEFLRNAQSFALTQCECRLRYQRCDNPLETCFLLGDIADRYVADGRARRITLAEAETTLRQADENGLVHLTIYMPNHRVYAVCSCCSCCCHDLQMLRAYQRPDLIAHSEYVARTDEELCLHCGKCIERCVFEARRWKDERMEYDEAACYGCGLCVSVCPGGATAMEPRVKDK
jgi:Pyruvate/2-oxoacid:ferredoxin oxidoreductase delta subunit